MLGPPAISEVMNPHVETVDPDAGALEAVGTLHERDIGSVLVVEDGDVVGILTESDVVALVARERDVGALTVTDVMSAPVETIAADADVVAAATRMRERGIKKLPVLEGGAVVGIVTTTDVSNYVPHVQHAREEARPTGGDVRQTRREDTAYEREDWAFEYVGHEAAIDVGDAVRFSKTLGAEDVEAFAEASGDTNRLHLDAGYAEGTRFGHRIAHGTLVAGVISAALARLPGLIIYLSQEVSYLGPVDVGDRVTAECEVVEDVGENRYRLATRVRDGDDEPVIDGEAVVIADEIPDTA